MENKMKRVSGLIILFAICMSLWFMGCSDDNGTDPEPETEHYIGWVVGSEVGGFALIYHTENSGTTWTRQGDASQITTSSLQDIAAVSKNIAWAVGIASDGYAAILKTTNGGVTWVRKGSPANLPNIELAGVDAFDDQTAWAAGDSGVIIKTTDGGETWTNISSDIPNTIFFGMIDALDENTLWAGGGDSNDSMHVAYKTTDGGATWTNALEGWFPGIQNYAIIDIAAFDDNIVWAVGSGAGAYVTSDGGQTWTDTEVPMAWYHVNGVSPVSADIAFIACDNDNVYKTTDRGATWVRQTCVTDSLAGFGEFMGITNIDPNIAWMVSADVNGGQIFNTLDGGENWNVQLFQTNGIFRRVSFVGDLK